MKTFISKLSARLIKSIASFSVIIFVILEVVCEDKENRGAGQASSYANALLGSFMSSFYACLLKICYLCRVFRVKNDEK
jgi:hypothetical protein